MVCHDGGGCKLTLMVYLRVGRAKCKLRPYLLIAVLDR